MHAQREYLCRRHNGAGTKIVADGLLDAADKYCRHLEATKTYAFEDDVGVLIIVCDSSLDEHLVTVVPRGTFDFAASVDTKSE